MKADAFVTLSSHLTTVPGTGHVRNGQVWIKAEIPETMRVSASRVASSVTLSLHLATVPGTGHVLKGHVPGAAL
jgi:hypothetical protein